MSSSRLTSSNFHRPGGTEGPAVLVGDRPRPPLGEHGVHVDAEELPHRIGPQGLEGVAHEGAVVEAGHEGPHSGGGHGMDHGVALVDGGAHELVDPEVLAGAGAAHGEAGPALDLVGDADDVDVVPPQAVLDRGQVGHAEVPGPAAVHLPQGLVDLAVLVGDGDDPGPGVSLVEGDEAALVAVAAEADEENAVGTGHARKKGARRRRRDSPPHGGPIPARVTCPGCCPTARCAGGR